MTSARDIMTAGAECARPDWTVTRAAQRMRDLSVGALPICGGDRHLAGMVTDRDIVLGCVAEGIDTTRATVDHFVGGEVVTVGPDDPLDAVASTMASAGVRRLPVVDGHDLVGMISQADVARNLREDAVGALLEAISTAPPTH
jgi:CBS domain-containing protein